MHVGILPSSQLWTNFSERILHPALMILTPSL
ncbi:hypothetical protein MTR67_003682 [Solanum verrucosum]|uniref:Uncharacterized protein n=1 Tax=Solanum verrucosum TaxID=315347 RepID=A0AAF0T739_SOLVR|nr:hypothetical protein MTR67_003682 [Solanum verrucosum]